METFNSKNPEHRKLLAVVIVVLVILTIAGVTWRIKNRSNKATQKAWYASQLKYQFSARIDTIILLRQAHGYGEVFFDKKDLDLNLEDSLNATLKQPIRFLSRDISKQIKFVIPGGHQYAKDDSICIDTDNQHIQVYRDRNLVATVRIGNALRAGWF